MGETQIDSDRFTFTADDNKLLTSVTRADGGQVPLDPLNADFCDFLGLASQGKYDGLSLGNLPTAKYLATMKQVVDTFKAHSAMLYIDKNGGPEIDKHSPFGRAGVGHSPRAQIQNTDKHSQISQWTFFRLYRASSVFDESRVDDDGSEIGPVPTSFMVSSVLLLKMREALTNHKSDIRCISTWPVVRSFVYFDVSEFSKQADGRQALIINQIGALTAEPSFWGIGAPELALRDLEASLCIGDGYIFVFSDAVHGVSFAAYMACLVERLVAEHLCEEIHFRVSVHTGPVYRFWDRWEPN